MTDISPDPLALGFSSLRLERWFSSDTDFNIGDPDPSDLSVQAPAGQNWLPPANGTLMLARTDIDGAGTPHRHLVGLRNAVGDHAFGPSPDQLIAIFTLFPLVHQRIQQLVKAMPPGRLASLSRPVPNRWVLRLPFPSDLSEFRTLINDSAAELEDLGFGDDLRPLPRPMTAGRRTTVGERETLIAIPPSTDAHLYCFDELGLPVDPGMVAAMFNELITEYDNLGESNLHLAPAPGRRIHLVGPYGGAVDSDNLSALTIGGSAPSSSIVTLGSGDQTITVENSKTRPHLRISTLPNGSRSATLALADSAMMARDCVRIGVMDYADLLTGTDRTSTDQQRASTRVNIAPTANGPTLLASADEILLAMGSALGAAGRSDAIASLGAFDGAIGAFPAPPTLPDIDPASFDSADIAPLHGGAGIEEGDWSPAMKSVLIFRFPAELIGAWVRVMPLGFDRNQAERVRMVGGSGIVANSTSGPRALVVITLPPGPSDRQVKVTFDIEILTARGRHVVSAFSLDRPPRPQPSDIPDTAPVILGPSGTAPGLFVCETAGNQLISGYNALIERGGGTFIAVDESATPGSAYLGSLASSFRATDRVVLTTPPWTGQDAGDGIPKLCLGATPPILSQRRRGDATQLIEPSGTLPGHDDRTVILSTATGVNGAAILSGGDLRAGTHQILGPPGGLAGEPAEAETHVAGVRLSGPAGRLLHEAALASGLAATSDLLGAAVAMPPNPASPTTPTRWASVLRTTRANIEGERTIDIAQAVTDYPVSGSDPERQAWLTAALPGSMIPTATGTAGQAAFDRAAARRVRAAAEGLAEALPALRAAIDTAERFVYIEAPSFTAGALGGAGTDLDILALLRDRLNRKPDMNALICVPQRCLNPFAHLRRYRTALQARIASELHDPGSLHRRANRPILPATQNERLVLFSPLGSGRRPLGIASTTVIIDDVVCFVGSTDITRRGLTFDASTMVGVVDDIVEDSISPEIRTFRTRLLADRLGEPLENIPLDGHTVTSMVAEMIAQDVSRAIGLPLPPIEDVQRGITDPSSEPTRDLNILQEYLDPDGRSTGSVAVGSYLAGLLTAITTGALASDASEPTSCG